MAAHLTIPAGMGSGSCRANQDSWGQFSDYTGTISKISLERGHIMSVKFNRLDQENTELQLNEEQLLAIEKEYLSAPLKSGGSFGPISWDVDFSIDLDDITKSHAYVRVSVMGFQIIDGRLDVNNPRLTVDLTVAGVGVKAEVGIDFDKRRIYFRGTLNFIFYSTDYDFTILSF